MRILLAALNAKYVHTNLALRYLREGVRTVFPDVSLREFSINDRVDRIAAEIYESKANVVGFSCYLWNIKEIMAVIRQLRPVCPRVKFVLGGPEVSFEAENFLLQHPEADVLIIGEGEEIFLDLLRAWQGGEDLSHIPGIAWRKDGKILINPEPATALSLNELPSPYLEEEDFSGRIVYVETTRGCPFNCQYCLSSTFQGVRFLKPENFRRMFRRLLKMGARTIKFVDRTFNVNRRHAFAILDIVREESAEYPDTEGIRVHCEMAGDLLDDEWMEYFANYPKGLMQLEIGVQSTNQTTLRLVSRLQSFESWKKYIPIMQSDGIPIHLDLIAGLPEEHWTSFRSSFNDVYSVEPDMLQLGFLKVLKGSGLYLNSGRYGLLFNPDPPYTILATNAMTHEELLQLERMEDVLDKYYNSGKFSHSVREVVKCFPTPFDFYHEFAEFWQKKGWFQRQWKGKALFNNLWEFLRGIPLNLAEENKHTIWERIRDALRFDYYLWERPNFIPDFLVKDDSPEWDEKVAQREDLRKKLREQINWEGIIPGVMDIERRHWYRNTAVAYFASDILGSKVHTEPCWYLFYYQQGKVKAYLYEGR